MSLNQFKADSTAVREARAFVRVKNHIVCEHPHFMGVISYRNSCNQGVGNIRGDKGHPWQVPFVIVSFVNDPSVH